MPRCRACGQMNVFVHEKTDRTYVLLRFKHGVTSEVIHHPNSVIGDKHKIFLKWFTEKGEINIGDAVACGICGSTAITNERDCKHTKVLHYKNKRPRCAECGARLFPEEGL